MFVLAASRPSTHKHASGSAVFGPPVRKWPRLVPTQYSESHATLSQCCHSVGFYPTVGFFYP